MKKLTFKIDSIFLHIKNIILNLQKHNILNYNDLNKNNQKLKLKTTTIIPINKLWSSF
jgi:N-dimethylarginine dimethylaminohydrolase